MRRRFPTALDGLLDAAATTAACVMIRILDQPGWIRRLKTKTQKILEFPTAAFRRTHRIRSAEASCAERGAASADGVPPRSAHEARCGPLPGLCGGVASRYGVDVRLVLSPGVEDDALPDAVAAPLYPVAKLALQQIATRSSADTVVVALRRSDDAVALTIADNGIGLEMERRLFRRDALDDMRDRIVGSGGQWLVQSEPGRGTRLTVCLPLSRDTRGARTTESSQSSESSEGDNASILKALNKA